MVTNERAFLQKMSNSSPEELLRAVRGTHDCKRHGTTSLFVALDIARGIGDRQVLATPSGLS